VGRDRAQVLVIDNYDSFTHNAVDLLEQLGARVAVVRNDAISVAEVASGGWRALVLSPGPGRPRDAGVCLQVVRRVGGRLPILGICLGHQVIAAAFGGCIVRARRPLHGEASAVHHQGEGLLRGLPRPFAAARYHSLVVDRHRPGRDLEVTAWSDEDDVMAIRHRHLAIEGLQFHPESYLTQAGPRLFAAFLRRAGLRPRRASDVRR